MYELVETVGALESGIARLAGASALAVDTEFVGERSYYPALELVQVADGRGVTLLIDTRATGTLAPLAPMMRDTGVLKIFHAANQDLSILSRACGARPFPHFDTQLAAAMAGLGAQISHTNLVRELLGISIQNHQTVSDWSRRPLTRDQLEYAAEDVAYLHTLRDKLEHRLRGLGRLEWFLEEQGERSAPVSEDDGEPEVTDDQRYTTVKEWTKLHGRELAVLQALAAWRESTARTEDVPRRTVMPDSALIGLARAKPRRRDDLKGVRYAPQGLVMRYADELLPTIARALELPSSEWPRKAPPQRPDIPTGFVEIMQALVRTTAEETQIAAPLLATTADLNALVANRRRARELDLAVLRGWRRAVIGEKLLDLLEGRIGLRIVDGERLEFG